MARMLTPTYKGKVFTAVEAIKSITPNPDDGIRGYKINWVYYNKEKNIYWYENQQGWVHILGVGSREVCNPRGKIIYFVRDFLITKDGSLKVSFDYDDYRDLLPTKEHVLAKLKYMAGKSIYA